MKPGWLGLLDTDVVGLGEDRVNWAESRTVKTLEIHYRRQVANLGFRDKGP